LGDNFVAFTRQSFGDSGLGLLAANGCFQF
jgi:hypothetical protein